MLVRTTSKSHNVVSKSDVRISLVTENIFPNWLEEKVELPIFDNIHSIVDRTPEPFAPVAVPVSGYLSVAPAVTIAPHHTEDLLREFENVYDAVELTHLTPPQSPPGPATQLLISYAHHAQLGVQPAPAPAPLALAPAPEPWHHQSFESELASVEELVRSRAAQLVSAASSPLSSPPSSPRSSTDEEWSASHRDKPYSRSTRTDDRRSRKKEQNKNAATRYRQKKKAEVEVLLTEEHKLRQRHSEIGDQCSDLQREIRYLKGLMRDLFKAKGLIK